MDERDYKAMNKERNQPFCLGDVNNSDFTVTPKGKKATRMYAYEIEHFSKLGKEIKISPKANITVNKAGFKTEFFVETVNVLIGIGNSHTADLIMSKDAWEALNSGEKINITTQKKTKKCYTT